jgi:hypothetical protein
MLSEPLGSKVLNDGIEEKNSAETDPGASREDTECFGLADRFTWIPRARGRARLLLWQLWPGVNSRRQNRDVVQLHPQMSRL